MLKLIALIALPLLTASCAADNLTPTTATGHEPLVCSQWATLTYSSKHDSPETIAQVRHNNARRAGYCTP